MKKSLPPGVIVAAVVLVLIVIGFAAYKTFGGDPTHSVGTAADVKAAAQMRKQVMAPGVHRDALGHFVDQNNNPINLSAAPTKGGQ